MDFTQIALAVLSATTVLMPVAEHVAARTKTKTDDRVLRAIRLGLAMVPRVRFGSVR